MNEGWLLQQTLVGFFLKFCMLDVVCVLVKWIRWDVDHVF